MGRSYRLNDGIEIEMSDRKTNRSGYTGAALSPAWTLNPEKPFIAACGNPTDPAIMSQMRAKHRTSWHGGAYSDAREAAYVVGMFKADPIQTDMLIEKYGVITDFPDDLYDLPEIVNAEVARDIILEIENNRRKNIKVVKPSPKIVDPAATDAFWNKYNKETMQGLVKKFGRETVQNAFRTLTISQFEVLFGLVSNFSADAV